MLCCAVLCCAGHVGLAFLNTTGAAAHVLRLLLWQQHHRSPLSSYNGSDAHGPREQSAALEAAPSSLLGALHHTLLMVRTCVWVVWTGRNWGSEVRGWLREASKRVTRAAGFVLLLLCSCRKT
jgi:hypothetical protein